MNPKEFTDKAPGACVKTRGGYHAFIPAGLPPRIEVDWTLTGLLSEADRALAELSGAGRLLPNPHLLIRPYLRREAILSSRIENTIAHMDQLSLFEIEKEPEPERPDVQEVANYVEALDLGLKRLAKLPISGRLIRELHAILLGGVRGGEKSKTPGAFRTSQNWIGRPGANLAEATFVPPPPHEMQEALSQWEKYVNGNSPEPILVQCAWMHYQFEAIHPFLDGNGRIGRLIITLFLCSRKSLSQPLLYLSGFFDETRDDYYRLLLDVSRKGAWREWLEYFLRGVRNQAQAALTDTHRILDAYEKYRGILKSAKRIPKTASGVLDELFGNPVFSIRRYQEKSRESFPNISKGVEFWMGQGLLREMTGRKRNRLFVSSELMDLMSDQRMPPKRAKTGKRTA